MLQPGLEPFRSLRTVNDIHSLFFPSYSILMLVRTSNQQFIRDGLRTALVAILFLINAVLLTHENSGIPQITEIQHTSLAMEM